MLRHRPRPSPSPSFSFSSRRLSSLHPPPHRPFRLSSEFVDQHRSLHPPFGFNGLGEVVYKRTYARSLGTETESWHQTVARVVEGTYNMQRRWIDSHRLGWDEARAQRSAQEMYSRIFHMKFLPPGRGLWAMGSPLTEERGLYAALNNCAFVSTADMALDPAKPFCFLMDAAMLGVGVGFDTLGADSVAVHAPRREGRMEVADSREGWVASVRALLDAFLAHPHAPALPTFDYSRIRPAGMPLKGFGGRSAGPEPLRRLHECLEEVLGRAAGQRLGVTAIVDIANLIGRCIVSGNIRNTAEIAFGDPSSTEFLDLKNYALNPHRQAYGWTSNNSVFASLGMDYGPATERVRLNGEPGFAWLENMRNYGRMDGREDRRDMRAAGGNPCLEQTLESYEMCCLVETFPANHDSLEDFQRTLKYAYLYAKTVTLGQTHWPETNRVLLRNRRIGCSLSGVAQFISRNGLHTLKEWCTQGYETIQKYDQKYSEWFAIPRSIKTTSIKPSGTVSLLAGATPGMHYPESRFYLRRMRLSRSSDLVPRLQQAGYHVEAAVDDPENTVVACFPIDMGEGIRSLDSVSMWEQLSLAAFLQRYWADNQVSVTVSFDPATEGAHIRHALDFFQYQLKGVSFLPRIPAGAYPQMPYEAISEERYREEVARLGSLDLRASARQDADVEADKFCDSDRCFVSPFAASQQ